MLPSNCAPKVAKPFDATLVATLPGQALCDDNFLTPLLETLCGLEDGTMIQTAVIGSRQVQLNTEVADTGTLNRCLTQSGEVTVGGSYNFEYCADARAWYDYHVRFEIDIPAPNTRYIFRMYIDGVVAQTIYYSSDGDEEFDGLNQSGVLQPRPAGNHVITYTAEVIGGGRMCIQNMITNIIEI